MKKRLIGILTALIVLLALSGCAKEEPAPGTATASADPNATYSGTIHSLSYDAIGITTASGEILISLIDSTVYQLDMAGGEITDSMEQLPSQEMGTPTAPSMDAMPERPSEGMGEITPPDGQTMPQGGSRPGFSGGMENMKLSVSSLTLGATVSVTTDSNGSAATVTLSVTGLQGGMQRPNDAFQPSGSFDQMN